MEIIAAVFAIMSVVAIILTVYDKIAAKNKARRIPEATLLLVGFLFGATAEYIVMLMIRHKTKHKKFMICLPIFIVLHIALIVLYYIYMR